MKVLLLVLFVAAATAVPIPDDDSGNVEFLVNGVPDGHALEIGDILDIKVKEPVNGQVVASDPLHPHTSVGIIEAAIAAAAAADSLVDRVPEVPQPIVLPEVPQPVVLPEVPEPVVLPVVPQPVVLPVVPQPVVLPGVLPEVPQPVVLPVVPEPVVLPEVPQPIVVPEPVIIPDPVIVVPSPDPEVVVEPVVEPEPLPSPSGQIYNDGVVEVTLNKPEDTSYMTTLQNWFNMVINYISNGVTSSQQIV